MSIHNTEKGHIVKTHTKTTVSSSSSSCCSCSNNSSSTTSSISSVAVVVIVIVAAAVAVVQGVPKNDPSCFCQNFAKSAPNLTVYGTQIAKTIQLSKVHSLSTSRNLCQRTTM